MFGHVAAGRDDAGGWQDLADKAGELMLVAARAVEGENERRAGCRRFGDVVVGVTGHENLL